MTEPKFTPGPYTASIETHSSSTGEWRTSYEVCVWKDTLKTVAEVFPIDGNDNETEATTYLLAAAPTMFKALETCRAIAERHELEYMVEYIDFILKKARGEA